MAAPRRAAAFRNDMQVVFQERRDILLKRLISDYRGGTLEHDRMVGTVAELSGMEEMIDRTGRDIAQKSEDVSHE